jgi:hypothetical protein
MTQPALRATCKQQGCPFADDGTCLEHYQPVEQCPHIELIDGVDAVPKADTATSSGRDDSTMVITESDPKFVPIYPAWALAPNEVGAVMGEAETTLVIVAGDTNSGKTSLIGLSYSAFLQGPVGEWRFAGSRTLLGYEELVQNHRASAEYDLPDTPHTETKVEEFYHLDIQSQHDGRQRRLLFHNVSGERYQDAINKTVDAAKLDLVHRADAIVVMVDGERLLKRASAAQAKTRLIDVLSALAQAKHLENNQPVQIVISRWDLVENVRAQEQINSQSSMIRDQVVQGLAEFGVTSQVTVFPVACVTHHAETAFGFGFSEVLEAWLALRPKPLAVPLDASSTSGRNEGWTSLASTPGVAPSEATAQHLEGTLDA